jgi:hypothetical protein
MFLLVFLQSLAGLRITGGVTETRFLYEEFRVRFLISGVLPHAWDNVDVTLAGMAGRLQTGRMSNKLYYDGTL